MICKSDNCHFWLFNECIKKNVEIIEGHCPHYKGGEIKAKDVFILPVVNTWEIFDARTRYVTVAKGHLLDVLASHYTEPNMSVYASSVKMRKKKYKYPYSFDMRLYLDFIDQSIYAMYLELLLLDYLDGSLYTITQMNSNGKFVHIKGELK